MKRILLLVVVFGLLAGGCNKTAPILQIHKFKNGEWERFEFLNFELPVEKDRVAYNISVELSFIAAFPSESLYVNVVMTTPSGEERIKDYNLTVKDRDGNFLGTKTDGIYKLSIPIRKGIRFNEAGVCKFEIENLMTKYVTPGIIDFGIKMEKNEKKN
jgi:gliding motility-associated lipoprotein GldH